MLLVAGVVGGGLLVAIGLQRAPAPAAPLPPASVLAASREAPAPVATHVPSAPARPSVPGPDRLLIPGLGIEAPLQGRALRADGDFVVPGDPRVVARWHGSGKPWGPGWTVLAGHVDSRGEPGALHSLASVRPGDALVTTTGDGQVLDWVVQSLSVSRKEDLPDFPATGPMGLAVVTCGGPVISTSAGRHYRDNVIVWARPAD